ncbi:hypothetical protein OSTOST_02250, partial [Ostertagia ostertagi]
VNFPSGYNLTKEEVLSELLAVDTQTVVYAKISEELSQLRRGSNYNYSYYFQRDDIFNARLTITISPLSTTTDLPRELMAIDRIYKVMPSEVVLYEKSPVDFHMAVCMRFFSKLKHKNIEAVSEECIINVGLHHGQQVVLLALTPVVVMYCKKVSTEKASGVVTYSKKVKSAKSEGFEGEKNEEWMDRAVTFNNVYKYWQSTKELAVGNISFSAYYGQVTVLLGHDGSGKTTIMKLISGDIVPSRGLINVLNLMKIHGKNLRGKEIGYCSQQITLFENLTVLEHLWIEVFNLKEENEYEQLEEEPEGKHGPPSRRNLSAALART